MYILYYLVLNFQLTNGKYEIIYKYLCDEGRYGDVMFGLIKYENNIKTPLFKSDNTIAFDGNEGGIYVNGKLIGYNDLRVREGTTIYLTYDLINEKIIVKLDEIPEKVIYSGNITGYYPFIEMCASPVMKIQLLKVIHTL